MSSFRLYNTLNSDAKLWCTRRDTYPRFNEFCLPWYLDVVKMSSNIIYVGNKPVLNYCQAIIQTLHDNDTAKLLARGTAISRAVDAVEVTRNRYLDGIKVTSIEIGTEQLRSTDGGIRNVSNVTIILEKQD